MTSIKGYTDLLRAGVVGALNEQQSNFLNVIRNNTERMSALVSDLSDLSHIESGRMKLNPVETRLASVLDDLLLLLRSRFDEKKQTLEVQLPADLPNLLVDSQRLVQVLTAILNNANKYSSEGSQVILRAAADGNRVRIEVQDFGIGVSSEDALMVFNQFFRSEDPKVREQQGWGLNLCVARNMVMLMNGEIGFESKVGAGSTFWIAVPACLTQGGAA
jgi:signal transduction histidine kinase